MTEEEITVLKAKAQETPKKKRLRLPSQEDPRATIRILEIPDKGSIQERTFNTPKMNDLEWERYKIVWEHYMDQVMVYCIPQQNMYTTEEMKIIQQGVFNYMTWNTIDIWDTIEIKLTTTITKAMPAPYYNLHKGIPWLAREWPNIEQYLQIGEIRETITDETVMEMSKEQIKEIQQLADTLQEEETSSEEEDVIITSQQTTTPKDKKLKQDLAKKNQEYQQKMGLGKTTSKKGVQFGNLPGEKPKKRKNKPDEGKGKGKKAEKDQSTSDEDDPGDDSNSSSESSDGGKSDSEDGSEENTRGVRQLSPSEKEWEQVTGKKRTAKRTNKMGKNKSLIKLPAPEMFDGTNKKWRNPTTFDQYTARIAEWLTYQELDIQKEEALSRFS